MPDYKEILRDLRDKREKLSAAIHAIEELAGERADPVKQSTGFILATRKPKRAYSRMRLKDAVTKCLNSAGKALNAPELREELIAGGYQTKSKDFRAQIYNVLGQDSKFTNESGRWSLAAWAD